MITVIGEHVVGNHRTRLEWVGKNSVSTSPSGYVDIGAVRADPESVDLSQTGVRMEWG